jgi:ferredoxin
MARKEPVWQAPEAALAAMPEVSGNSVNGLGEQKYRPASPFFWHDPCYHAFGEMQAYTLRIMYGLEDAPAILEAFQLRGGQDFRHRGPEPIPVAPGRVQRPAAEWSERVKAFALDNDADVVGIAEMRPEWVFEGFEIREKYVIVVGVAHNYEKISQAPSLPGNNEAIVEIGRQYTRAAVAAAKLHNFLAAQGYPSTVFPGPVATDLLMIPAAVAAGLGELGKHGSLINRKLGSSFRLSAVTTDMPLAPDAPDVFGADEFCKQCQLCRDACPPDAIYDQKQWVRGDRKWYVDFDKCIPYFAESRGCGICIAVCPWSRPGVADRLVVKMAQRRALKAAS